MQWMMRVVGPVAFLALLGAAVPAAAAEGSVVFKNGALHWGQYRSVSGVIGVNRPQGAEAVALHRLPLHGAAVELIRCQRQGLFEADGTLAETPLAALREELERLYRLDMLPLLVLFEPGAEAHLASRDAYTSAAEALYRALADDYFFLFCITDRADDPRWNAVAGADGGDGLAIAVAQALKAIAPDQLLAAGGMGEAVNEALMGSGAIDVVMRAVNEPGLPEGPLSPPRIDVLPASALDNVGAMKGAVAAVIAQPTYGFAIDFSESVANAAVVGEALAALGGWVSDEQIARTGAMPIAPDDTASLKPGEAAEGFVSLFNGRDLSGWVPLTREENDFIVEDGAIVLDKRTGGWLRSWERYGDFVFRAEYKIEPGGNSGLYIRAPLNGRQSRIGFEFQIFGDPVDGAVTPESSGAIYDVRPPDANRIRPGEWNEVEITCIGESVRIVWNGEVVHDFSYDAVERMRGRSVEGYIGLQDHYDNVSFRNLRIKRLD